MENYIVKNGKKLKKGYTTGACCAAGAKAAATTLLTGEKVNHVKIETLLLKSYLIIDVSYTEISPQSITCSVTKDGGDDPDATHGAEIFAKVSLCEHGLTVVGGEGVGIVTKNGLPCKIGEPAINPGPLKMIKNELAKISKVFGYEKGFHVTISVPKGLEIAKKTMNPRLGIMGGVSILGTTGIVEPMSEKALIDTIKAEIDIQTFEGNTLCIITPGNYGNDFAKNKLNINMEKALKCSNFIGETLDYACYKGVKEILLIGHAGKLVKLAGGIMNTHSKIADCRMEIIAAHLALSGGTREQIIEIMGCVTTEEAASLLINYKINNAVWESIGKKIHYHLQYRTQSKMKTNFIIFTCEHGVLCKNL